MTLNIDDFDQVKLYIEQLKKAVKDERFADIQYYDLEILTNNEKKTINASEFFIVVIDKHPTIIPHILEYVNSIETTIINPEEDTPPLGLIPVAALAVIDTQYLKELEKFFKMLRGEGNSLSDMITGDSFYDLLASRAWDENTIKFIAYYIYELKHEHSVFLPKDIKPALINLFLEEFFERIKNSPAKGRVNVSKYELEELLVDVLHEDVYLSLQEFFDEFHKAGKIPTYHDLKNGNQSDEYLKEYLDETDYVAKKMQDVANRAKKDKAEIKDFIIFIHLCDFDHPTGQQVEADIMKEVLEAWDWCPETIELAVVCFFTPAQWLPSQSIPMYKTMSPEMFDLFMKKMCDEAFNLDKYTPKSYDENYELNLAKEDYVERNFCFGFVMGIITNHFDKDEAHLRTELNKAIAQNFYPTYQFFETGKM